MLRTVSAPSIAPSTEIERQSCHDTTNLSSGRKFSKVAKVVWLKPAPTIASIMGCDIRTAQRILAGQAEVPWCVLRALLDEILKP